uniref:Uncharacterized protein n=1 Tax=Rhizophora mucronata TaxID=61149 RepID=A0A2P2NDT9_RHIMU
MHKSPNPIENQRKHGNSYKNGYDNIIPTPEVLLGKPHKVVEFRLVYEATAVGISSPQSAPALPIGKPATGDDDGVCQLLAAYMPVFVHIKCLQPPLELLQSFRACHPLESTLDCCFF